MKIEKKYDNLIIDGKYFVIDMKDGKPIFIPQPKHIVEKRLKMSKEIAVKLKKDLNAEAILTETLMTRFNLKELEKLHNQLFKSKIKYKPKTRVHRCVDMKVGNTIIPLLD